MRAGWSALALAALLLGLAPAAPGQELSVSFGAGGSFPSSSANRRIYGSGPSVAADISLRLRGHLGLSLGYGRLADSGSAVPAGEGQDVFPLKIRRTSIPVLLFYELDAGPATFRLGAGFGFHSFSETWQTVDFEFRGHKVAPRLALAVGVKILGPVSLMGSACYESIPTGAGSALDPNVDLGGFQIFGGLAFKIF